MKAKVFMGLASLTAGTRSDFLGKVEDFNGPLAIKHRILEQNDDSSESAESPFRRLMDTPEHPNRQAPQDQTNTPEQEQEEFNTTKRGVGISDTAAQQKTNTKENKASILPSPLTIPRSSRTISEEKIPDTIGDAKEEGEDLGFGRGPLDDFKTSVKTLQKKLGEFKKKDGWCNKDTKEFLRNYLLDHKALTSYVTRAYDAKDFNMEGCMVMDDDEEWLYKQIVEVAGPEALPYRAVRFQSKTNIQAFPVRSPSQSNFMTTFTLNTVGGYLAKGRAATCPYAGFERPRDVYQIRHAINAYEFSFLGKKFCARGPSPINPKNEYDFVLAPNYKDAHATLFLLVLDKKASEVSAAIFFNSNAQDNSYTERKFNFKGFYRYGLKDGDVENKEVERKGASIKAWSYGGLREGVIPNFELCADRVIPFIDISTPLQTAKDDHSCTLYGLTMMEGMIDMLATENNRNKILSLAKGPQKDLKKLQNFVKDSLKQHTPYWNHETEQPLSSEELQLYHQKMRWEISNKCFKHVFLEGGELGYHQTVFGLV